MPAGRVCNALYARRRGYWHDGRCTSDGDGTSKRTKTAAGELMSHSARHSSRLLPLPSRRARAAIQRLTRGARIVACCARSRRTSDIPPTGDAADQRAERWPDLRVGQVGSLSTSPDSRRGPVGSRGIGAGHPYSDPVFRCAARSGTSSPRLGEHTRELLAEIGLAN